MTVSVAGFIIGLILAIIFYVIATALIVFAHSTVVFGLIALLIWACCTFGGVGGFTLRR